MRLRNGLMFVLPVLIAVLGFAGSPLAQTKQAGPKPVPSIGPGVAVDASQILQDESTPSKDGGLPIAGTPPFIDWGAYTFLDNPTYNGGFYYIPPDPHGAAGPEQVVNVGNDFIQWFDKFGTLQHVEALKTFFAPLGPPLGTTGFDPKVLYDQYAERFVVVTLERTSVAGGDPTDDSYILVAVSKTSDPNAGWWYHAIHSKLTIGGSACWADYPGLAVDDKAIYITSNMFTFPGAYAAMRLWIVDKAPLYAGGAGVSPVYDPYTASGYPGYDGTTMPTHMYGALPGMLGTYLVAYSSWTYGGVAASELLFVMQVDDPVGVPTFTQQWVPVGDLEDVGGGFGFPPQPDAPQFGTAATIEVNDSRCLDAVWRDGQLYACASIVPNAGADVGQTTAHWWRVDTTPGIGGLAVADQGNAGAEDIGAGTFTFFPSISVDKCGNMALGFAASNGAIYPGAYYAGRMAADAAGTIGPTGVLHAGTDYYYRAFGGSRNRWGDYTGCALDPSDEATFWVYNEYAMSRGTIFASLPTEDGRWATHWGAFTLGCQPVSVAITGFDARAGRRGVELTASFAADFNNFRVNVYRQDDRLETAMLYKTIEMNGRSDLSYVDDQVEPGKTYSYFIGAVDKDGEFYSPTMKVTVPEMATTLRQNSPNPFNPTTTISFDLPTTEAVTLVVYDASGRAVRTLVNEVRRFGPHKEVWDGTDDAGNRVGSGVYFYRIKAGSFEQSRKMVLIK